MDRDKFKTFGLVMLAGAVLGCICGFAEALVGVFILHRRDKLNDLLDFADEKYDAMRERQDADWAAVDFSRTKINSPFKREYVSCMRPQDVEDSSVPEVVIVDLTIDD